MPTTVESLPDLSSEYTITPEQIEQYRRDGHIILRGIASPQEIAAYREVIVDTVRRHNPETRPMEQRDTYGKAFLQTMILWEVDERVKRFTFSRRFAKLWS